VSNHGGWIGVDFDGTLATYDGWHGPNHTGQPIPEMVERVKAFREDGIPVRIFTARVYNSGRSGAAAEVAHATAVIEQWCLEHIGEVLPVTCQKDFGMMRLYDDRCVQVETNTGKVLGRE